MSGMSDLDIVLRETMTDLKGMEMRAQELQTRLNSVYGGLDPVSEMLAKERIPDELYEWLQTHTQTASAQSIGCEYILLGAKEPLTKPGLRLIEMDGTYVSELDSWDEANAVNYGTALRMMANHVEQDLEREQTDGDDGGEELEF